MDSIIKACKRSGSKGSLFYRGIWAYTMFAHVYTYVAQDYTKAAQEYTNIAHTTLLLPMAALMLPKTTLILPAVSGRYFTSFLQLELHNCIILSHKLIFGVGPRKKLFFRRF